MARRLITVASGWSWVAIGGAVFLGNATARLLDALSGGFRGRGKESHVRC